MKRFACAALVAVGVWAMPAGAQVTVYTDQASFAAAHPHIAVNGFSFRTGSSVPSSSYSQSGVSFTSSYIFQENDGAYGQGVSYLGIISGPSLYVQYSGSALGLVLASQGGGRTISYTVNGQAGTLSLGANQAVSFLGFDTALPTLTAVFALSSNELDVLSFQTAVPEAATWAMMMVGLGVVGGSLRRRRNIATWVAFA